VSATSADATPTEDDPMSKSKRPSPNDQRSNVKNPNNPAHKANRDNRANQRNPNHAPSGPTRRK
jgi:hypothetical protein